MGDDPVEGQKEKNSVENPESFGGLGEEKNVQRDRSEQVAGQADKLYTIHFGSSLAKSLGEDDLLPCNCYKGSKITDCDDHPIANR